MTKKKLNNGYSLIEIILYVVLLGMFLTTITSLFVSSLDLRLETEATSSVEQDERYFLSKFRYDLLNSSSIVTPGSPGSSSGTLELVRDGVTYTYALDNDNLMVTDGTNSDQLNSTSSKVTAINFTRLGNSDGKNTITIDFTLESVAARSGEPEVKDFTVTYGIR